jgi:hypothetical protein
MTADIANEWYFAIGSMMNPKSLHGRDIHPLLSIPARIIDYELGFFGPGFAEALSSKGRSFHGVLHQISLQDGIALDKIEASYLRMPCLTEKYDGECIEAFVYCRDHNKVQPTVNNPPSERYLSILIEGCLHYRVDQSHIDYLKSLPFIPRKNPSDYAKLAVPPGLKVWTMEDVKKGDGIDGNPVYFTLNGKVIEYIGKEGEVLLHFAFMGAAGKNAEVTFSKQSYEPKYGMYDSIEFFTQEHCAYVEDAFIQRSSNHYDKFKVIALYEQCYQAS